MSANLKNFNKRCELTYKIQPAELKQAISCGAFIKLCQQVLIDNHDSIVTRATPYYGLNSSSPSISRGERAVIAKLAFREQSANYVFGYYESNMMPHMTKSATNQILAELSTTYNVPVKM